MNSAIELLADIRREIAEAESRLCSLRATEFWLRTKVGKETDLVKKEKEAEPERNSSGDVGSESRQLLSAGVTKVPISAVISNTVTLGNAKPAVSQDRCKTSSGGNVLVEKPKRMSDAETVHLQAKEALGNWGRDSKQVSSYEDFVKGSFVANKETCKDSDKLATTWANGEIFYTHILNRPQHSSDNAHSSLNVHMMDRCEEPSCSEVFFPARSASDHQGAMGWWSSHGLVRHHRDIDLNWPKKAIAEKVLSQVGAPTPVNEIASYAYRIGDDCFSKLPVEEQKGQVRKLSNALHVAMTRDPETFERASSGEWALSKWSKQIINK